MRVHNPIYQSVLKQVAQYLYKKELLATLKNKSILFVGASGLIGTFFVDLIAKINDDYKCNIQMTLVGRNKQKLEQLFGAYNNIKLKSHDVFYAFDEMGNFNYVISAASNTHPVAYSSEPVATITTNVMGTYNLLEYARTHAVKRFLFLSSVEIYGEALNGQMQFAEKDFGYLDCNTVRAGYCESKRVAESLCQAYIQKYDMDIVIPRICRVYGPTMQQDDSKALAQFIKNAINGEDIVLKSEGNQFFSYIDVFDCVSALLTILAKGTKGSAYNVSSKKSNISLKDLASKIARRGGVNIVYQLPTALEKKGFSKATRAILDNSALCALDWSELFDIDTGLDKTLKILKDLKND